MHSNLKAIASLSHLLACGCVCLALFCSLAILVQGETPHLGLAKRYFTNHDLGRAESEIRQALTDDPKSAEAYNLLGQIRIQQGRLSAAQQSFGKAVEIAPRLADAYENLALLELLRHKNREAESAARKLLELDPSSYNGHLVAGVVNYIEKQYQQSLAYLAPLTGGVGPDPIALAVSTENCERLGRPEDAKKFKRAIDSMTIELNDALLAARLLQSREFQPYLVRWLQQVRARGADTFQVRYELGNAHFRMNQLESAKQNYLTALGKKPPDANVLLQLSAVSELLGDTRSASNYMYQAMQAPKNDFPTLMHYSFTCIRRHMLIDAKRALQQALKLQPGDSSAQYALGVTAYGLGDFNMAEQQFRAVLQASPSDAQAHVSLGVVFLATSRPGRAEEEFRTALRTGGASAAPHYYLAQIYRRRGQNAVAKKELKESLKLDPQDARIYADLAGIEIGEGKLDTAETRLRSAINLDSKSAKARYQLGILLRKRGQLEESKKEFHLAQTLRDQEEKNAVVLLISKESHEYGDFLPSAK